MDYRQILVAMAIALSLSGCTPPPPQFDSVYTRISPGILQAGQPIPLPKGKVVLTVTGKIKRQGATPGSPAPKHTQIAMDRAALEAVGQVEYEVQDLFENKPNRFRGILMRDLLDLWQVPPEATQITFTALNDYQITIPISLLKQYPILLALQQNDTMMQPDYRGPAMIVTPYQQYPSVEALKNRNHWIWQVAKVHVE